MKNSEFKKFRLSKKEAGFFVVFLLVLGGISWGYYSWVNKSGAYSVTGSSYNKTLFANSRDTGIKGFYECTSRSTASLKGVGLNQEDLRKSTKHKNSKIFKVNIETTSTSVEKNYLPAHSTDIELSIDFNNWTGLLAQTNSVGTSHFFCGNLVNNSSDLQLYPKDYNEAKLKYEYAVNWTDKGAFVDTIAGIVGEEGRVTNPDKLQVGKKYYLYVYNQPGILNGEKAQLSVLLGFELIPNDKNEVNYSGITRIKPFSISASGVNQKNREKAQGRSSLVAKDMESDIWKMQKNTTYISYYDMMLINVKDYTTITNNPTPVTPHPSITANPQ